MSFAIFFPLMVDASPEDSLLNLQEGLNVLWEWGGIMGTGKQGKAALVSGGRRVWGVASSPLTWSYLQCVNVSPSFKFILHTCHFQLREAADGFVQNQ